MAFIRITWPRDPKLVVFSFYFRISPGFPCNRIIKIKNVYKNSGIEEKFIFQGFCPQKILSWCPRATNMGTIFKTFNLWWSDYREIQEISGSKKKKNAQKSLFFLVKNKNYNKKMKTSENEFFSNTWILLNIFNFDDPITGESWIYPEVKKKVLGPPVMSN